MATKQAELLDPAPQGVALRADDSLPAMFERLATSNASVETIERLMALYERGQARTAEAAFNTAMSDAQEAMRPVAADASNPQTKSRYASYEALDRALRPTYTKHGFALSFNTGEGAPQDFVRVLCLVTHRGGHTREYHLDMPADGKGAKGGDVMTKTHATGSAVSYGMRYLLKMIFNVAVGGEDDDGNKAGRTVGDAPDGYPGFVDALQAVAENGWPELSRAWDQAQKTTPAFCTYLTKSDGRLWKSIKDRADAVTKGGRRA